MQFPLIYYASYGSNMLESRFHCYIRGGQPEGSVKTQPGCLDHTLPTEKANITIHRELYFARESGSWQHGGVAFINPEANEHARTLGRMYLITAGQFIDIIRQENDFYGKLLIDFEKAIEQGSLIIHPTWWYGNLLYLGDKNGHPIFTFTHATHQPEAINPPGANYLRTIINGLKEAYHLSNQEIYTYLKDKPGIRGTNMLNDL
jgi:hypothetical protein